LSVDIGSASQDGERPNEEQSGDPAAARRFHAQSFPFQKRIHIKQLL
jgi:hypothetical protein